MFLPKGPVDKNPWPIQIMAEYRAGDKPSIEPMMDKFTVAYMRHLASTSCNEDHAKMSFTERLFKHLNTTLFAFTLLKRNV